jgi:hypothetical protein
MSIGGDMQTMYSPWDPLFYVHHAYIDSIWWKWQRLNTANFYNGQTTSTTNMVGVSSSQRDVFNTRALANKFCYSYDGITTKRSESEETEFSKFEEFSEIEDVKKNKKFDKDPKIRRQAEAEELLAPIEIPKKLPAEWFEMNGINQQEADETYDFYVTEATEINKIWKERKSSF